MKRFSRLISIGLSALMLISGSSVAAGALSVNDCGSVKVISNLCGSDLQNCGLPQSVVQKLCGSDCDVNSLLEALRQGGCIGGDCSAPGSSQPASEPSTQPVTEPAQPVTEPTQPVVQPTQPAVEPTQPAAQSSEFNSAYENEVISLVNAERARYGLPALSRDDGAVAVARVRAKEIVTSFSHTRPNGSSCFTAANELGVSYRSAGENIAYGYSTPQQVVNGWMNSEGHRKNILSSSFTKLGVGCYKSGGTLYWSQFFIG